MASEHHFSIMSYEGSLGFNTHARRIDGGWTFNRFRNSDIIFFHYFKPFCAINANTDAGLKAR